MRGVPHHLTGILRPDEDFSVARYADLARACIADIHARGKLPILAGGTGLYISAIADHIQYGQIPENADLRARLRREAYSIGGEAMLNRLHEVDPTLAASLHPNNLGRIIRGIEVYELTGEPLSEWQKRSRALPGIYHLCILGLAFHDRDALYGRIERRVDAMLASGLLEEAKALCDAGFSGTAAQAIGYKELWGHLRGEQTLEEVAAKLKQETRRYAKRQLTWFRRDRRIRWLYLDNPGGYEAALREAHKLAAPLIL
jgi:tRNA dimethylallyltransferase